jgi:pilus assembly protein Flp/PilA
VIGNRTEQFARHPNAPRSRVSDPDDFPGMRKTTRRTVPRRALKSKRGITAIEYARIAALIAVVIVTAVALIGSNRAFIFDMIAGHADNPAD